MFPFGETVTQHVRTVTGQDADGNDVYGETNRTHRKVAVYPRDNSGGDDLSIAGVSLVFVPAITTVATDQWTVRGERFHVDGDPAQYLSPISGHTMTKLNLLRAKGGGQ